MPFPIVALPGDWAVIILTGGSDWGHGGAGGGDHGETGSCAINDCSAIIDCMASITIRNLEENTKRKLKVRAAENGRSMEQEAREILKSELERPRKPRTGAELVERIRAIWEPLGGVDLELPPREPMRDPDWLKDWK